MQVRVRAVPLGQQHLRPYRVCPARTIRACYAMSGTELAYGGLSADGNRGTELAYGPTRLLRDVRRLQISLSSTGSLLRTPYALSGTHLATCLRAVRYRHSVCLVLPWRMPGTAIAHGTAVACGRY
eukprot:1202756-Rhodomonas_salina.2